MNQKQIGIILIIIGIALAAIVFTIKYQEDKIIKQIIAQEGTCFLENGTCLHEDRTTITYTIGWIISAALMILGIYLSIFDKTQKVLAEHQVKVASALKESKKDERFNAFLQGFNEDEKRVLSSIKEQDGILQSTLRYRTGITKSSLSLLLKSLEERELISRKESGKTNKVFLRKKY